MNTQTKHKEEKTENRDNIKYTRLDLTELFPDKRDAFAIIVDNVFSEKECKEIIEKSMRHGYTEQKNKANDKEFTDTVYERIKHVLPREWLGAKVMGINEKIRFLKYNEGDYYKTHNDGIFVKADKSACSYLTIHLYFSEIPEGEGGETTFNTEEITRNNNNTQEKREDGEKEKEREREIKRLSVRSVIGRALIFEHNLPHEESKLLKGEKFSARVDVLYNLEGKPPNKGSRWNLKVPHPQYIL